MGTAIATIETARFRACSGQTQGFGTTPGEALHSLMARLPNGEVAAPIVVLPFNRGDAFFTDAQQARLQELKALHETRTPAEDDELENLIAASFDATVARTQNPCQEKSLKEQFDAIYDKEDSRLDPLFVELQARSLPQEEAW